MDNGGPQGFTIRHDGIGHHPLLAGSYYWRKDVVDWLYNHTEGLTVNLFVGVQPNSPPHIGTLMTLGIAFVTAKKLQELGKTVLVYFDSVDTAPATGSHENIDDVIYQKSLRWTKTDLSNLAYCREILENFSRLSGVDYVMRNQADMMSHPLAMEQLREILNQRASLEKLMGRQGRGFGLRATCPHPDCGLSDKSGILNRYFDNSIEFQCPRHGPFSLSLDQAEDVIKIELNSPLRNLIRHLIFRFDKEVEWIEILGADFAGFYNEQLLWRPLAATASGKQPLVLYTPLVLDWSGSKVSKSLSVQKGAYNHLKTNGLDYMLSYKVFKESSCTLESVYSLCENWVSNPYKLFRCYTVYHVHDLLREEAKKFGTTELNGNCAIEEVKFEEAPVLFIPAKN
jgi:hypothetical protein